MSGKHLFGGVQRTLVGCSGMASQDGVSCAGSVVARRGMRARKINDRLGVVSKADQQQVGQVASTCGDIVYAIAQVAMRKLVVQLAAAHAVLGI